MSDDLPGLGIRMEDARKVPVPTQPVRKGAGRGFEARGGAMKVGGKGEKGSLVPVGAAPGARVDKSEARAKRTAEDVERIDVSKKVSYILRGGAVSSGVPEDDDGWIKMADLRKANSLAGVESTKLERLIEEANALKQRYEFRQGPGGVRLIRAIKGPREDKTAPVESQTQWQPMRPPAGAMAGRTDGPAWIPPPGAAAPSGQASKDGAAASAAGRGLPMKNGAGEGSTIRDPVAPGAVSPQSRFSAGSGGAAAGAGPPGRFDTGSEAQASGATPSSRGKAKQQAVSGKTIRAPPLQQSTAAGHAAARAAFAPPGRSNWPGGDHRSNPNMLFFMQRMQAMHQMMIQSQYQVHVMRQLQDLMKIRMMHQMHSMGINHNPMQAMWEAAQAKALNDAGGDSPSKSGFWDWATDFFGDMDWENWEDWTTNEEEEEDPIDPADMTSEQIEERLNQVLWESQERLREEKAMERAMLAQDQDDRHWQQEDDKLRRNREKAEARRSAALLADSSALEAQIQQTLKDAVSRNSAEKSKAVARGSDNSAEAPEVPMQSRMEAQVAIALAAARERNGPAVTARPKAKAEARAPATTEDLKAKFDEVLQAARERTGKAN